MKRLMLLAILLSCVFGLQSASIAQPVREVVQVGDRSREFLVLSPPASTKPLPVIIVFHGGSRTAEKTLRVDTAGAWDAVAASGRAIVLVPEGRPQGGNADRRSWNDCRADISPDDPATSDWDDVAFFDALVDWATKKRGADPRKVYITGASNGGLMVYRILKERPGKVAAAAVQIANLPMKSKCGGGPIKTPVILTTGTLDRLMPAAGGCIAFDCAKGSVVSLAQTVADLRSGIGATRADPPAPLPDKDLEDRSSVVRHVYRTGAGRTVLIHDEIIGGGHSAPGGPQWPAIVRDRMAIGWRNRDISSVDESLRFFGQFEAER